MTNVNRNPSAHNMGVFIWILPRHSVATHENTLTPVGIAMMTVVTIIGMRSHGDMPDTNMWWAHTPKPSTAIATVENATAR